MSFDYFIGIDPGKTGGIVTITKGRVLLDFMIMSDTQGFINYLSKGDRTKTIAVIEKAQALPRNGAVSMFNYGQGYGELLGVMAALCIPYTTVPPITWSRLMHSGIPKILDTKRKSAIAVSQLFPGADLRAKPSAKNPHEGLVDALLLAEYGRLKYDGKTIH